MDGTRTLAVQDQARKVARYCRLYGVRRTWAKVESEVHHRGRSNLLPTHWVPHRSSPNAHVGMIGCGNFGYSTLAYYLTAFYGPVIRGVMDSNLVRARSLGRRYGAHFATEDVDAIINDPKIDLVYIASNHASHADYAVRSLRAGKSVHIEKPHVVTREQLVNLVAAMAASRGSVGLGFNRPCSPLGEMALDSLASESGPMLLAWFVAGHAIDPDHWYYRPEEGGRILGNICHWTDFIWHAAGGEHNLPVRIVPSSRGEYETNISVSYEFADDSLGVVAFSAKGHTFEGVHERLSAHRGHVLLHLDNFHRMEIHRGSRRHMIKGRVRDHGHGLRVSRSYEMVRSGLGHSPGYVWNTGRVFLATRSALQEKRPVVVEAEHPPTTLHLSP